MAVFYSTDQARTDAIARRLDGRLEFDGTPSAFGRQPVDSGLVQQVATQAESRVASAVRKRYKWPLVTPHRLELQEIVEKLAVCDLLPIHFHGTEVSNDGGMAKLVCGQAERLLKAICTGELLLEGELDANTSGAKNFYGSRVKRRSASDIEDIDWGSSTREPAVAVTRRIIPRNQRNKPEGMNW